MLGYIKSFILVTLILDFYKINTQNVNVKIRLDSIKENDTFPNPFIMIKGRLDYRHTGWSNYDNSRTIEVTNNDYLNNSEVIEKNWPISSQHEFKAYVNLKPGLNRIKLKYNFSKYENDYLELSLNYDSFMNKEPLHLVIILANDSKGEFDMDDYDSTERNDLNSTIKRFRTVALLWQALTAETLYKNDLGRRSFRFEMDSNNSKKISILFLNISQDCVVKINSVLIDFFPHRNNIEIFILFYLVPVINIVRLNVKKSYIYAMNDLDLFYFFYDSIKNSSFYAQKKKLGEDLHVSLLIGDTHWNYTLQKLYAIVAMANQIDGLNIGMFGSHLGYLENSFSKSPRFILPNFFKTFSSCMARGTKSNNKTIFRHKTKQK